MLVSEAYELDIWPLPFVERKVNLAQVGLKSVYATVKPDCAKAFHLISIESHIVVLIEED